MSVREEELMALYGIAKDEIEGIEEASERLEKAIQQLERLESTIGMYSHRGINECLSDFKRESSLTLSQEIKNVSYDLRTASTYAQQALDRQDKLYWLLFFVLGMSSGLCLTYYLLSDHIINQEVYQERTYQEVLGLKPKPKPHKVKGKAHKKAVVKKEEDDEEPSEEGAE
jgi:hypothetical protein